MIFIIFPLILDQNDLGFSITGGHSIPHCMEVTARIEKINTRHRNYNILRNAVQEGKSPSMDQSFELSLSLSRSR